MDDSISESTIPTAALQAEAWSAPAYEVIALDCEITAYAPDGGDPLF